MEPLLLAPRWHFGRAEHDQNTKGPNNFVPQIWHAKFRPWPLRYWNWILLTHDPAKGWKGYSTPLDHTITQQEVNATPLPTDD